MNIANPLRTGFRAFRRTEPSGRTASVEALTWRIRSLWFAGSGPACVVG